MGEADWGTVVLMEVATGEIHAMSNLTRKGPGRYSEDFNYAIGRRMEPGSTFKLATLIALLDDAGMSLEEMIDCENGRARVGRRMVTDDHKEGVISLRRVFEVSSNIGFAKAVNERYGANPGKFVDRINKMGFDRPLGIEIAGEQAPLIKHPDNRATWDGTSLVMMSYGYALEVTPMHTLALYNAVANEGRLMRPKLVREVQNYGETVNSYASEVINTSICSKKTIGLVRECLEGVVDEGTGRLLRNDHYTVAAKTGTAQVAFDNGGYMDSRGGRNYLATMVGYFPADNPKYTCIVAIKTYHGPGRRNTYYGASLSGPVFKAIADRVYAVNSSWHETVDNSGERLTAQAAQVKNGNLQQLEKVSAKLSLPIQKEEGVAAWAFTRQGDPVKVLPDSLMNDKLPRYIVLNTPETEDDTVPSVVGMGLRDAVYLLESLGMRVSFTGKGRVVSQSVAAGTAITAGSTVELKLSI